MKERTKTENMAANTQASLLVEALERAKTNNGVWLNANSRPFGPSIMSKKDMTLIRGGFNQLIIGLHSDSNECKANCYGTFKNIQTEHDAVVRKGQKGVPFVWYNWNKYASKADPSKTITRDEYEKLSKEEQKDYKVVRTKNIYTMFNMEQTTLKHVNKEAHEAMVLTRGGGAENLVDYPAFMTAFCDELGNTFKSKDEKVRDAAFDVKKQTLTLPKDRGNVYTPETMQNLFRAAATATGINTLSNREGLYISTGSKRHDDAIKYERLVNELASGVMMQSIGKPATLSKESMGMIDYWQRELQENPCLVDALERDINNSVDIMTKIHEGKEIKFHKPVEVEQKSTVGITLTAEECAVMQDIIRKGGMDIDVRNFENEAAKQAFMEKFGIAELEKEKVYALSQTKSNDAEIVDLAYTNAVSAAQKISEKLTGYAPSKWEIKDEESHKTYDALKEEVSDDRKVVVVADLNTGIYDVVMPKGAFTGGKIVLPSGDKASFYLTPDEVMSESERKERGVTIERNDSVGFNKDRIEKALMKDGAKYVRFFNNGGSLGYMPDDKYFVGKKITTERLIGWNLINKGEIQPVKPKEQYPYEKALMVRSMTNDKEWELYIKPKGAEAFIVVPERKEANAYFTALHAKDDAELENVRQNLVTKYMEAGEKVRKPLIDNGATKEDMDRIKYANLFKGKDGKMLCKVAIDGQEKIHPRYVTEQQWQRMFLASDKTLYKKALAVSLFKDVLHPEVKVGKTVKQAPESSQVKQAEKKIDAAQTEKKEEKVAVKEGKSEDLTDEKKRYIDIKAKNPNVLLLFRNGDNYDVFFDDAIKASKILHLPLSNDTAGEERLSFNHLALDGNLPIMVRAGERVAVADTLDDPNERKVAEQESSVVNEEESNSEEEEEHRSMHR